MQSYVLKGRLIDVVTGKITEDGLVLVTGNKVQYAGSQSRCPSLPLTCHIIEKKGGTILPGFIDCHVHLCGTGGEDCSIFTVSDHDRLLQAAADINDLLDAGFTTLRDMSSYGAPLKRAIEKGSLRGPRIIPGGRVLSPTSGHCDCYPGLTQEQINQVSPIDYLVDGVESCLRGVRVQFREGAEFIKICATGGVSSAGDSLSDIQFSFEEMQAIVEEARRHGTYVAAHCSGCAGTLQALRAGIGCVEHGDDLDLRCIEIMAAKDIPLVTTLYVTWLCAESDIMPSYMQEKAASSLHRQIESMMMARSAGICIALGTDFSNSSRTPYLKNGMEFEAIVRSGFTPLEALQAGTINAARAIRYADTLGSLIPGKLADLVIVKGNPLEDISLLADADHVLFVMKDGQIQKNIP